MIRLSEDASRSVLDHAARAYPAEACGFLLGNVNGVDKEAHTALPLDNGESGATRLTRYLVSPTDYRAAELLAAKSRLALVGIYHSHPDHPAAPSERDRAEALPFFSYLIVSVVAGKTKQTRSFVLMGDRTQFVEESVAHLEPISVENEENVKCP